MKPEYKQGRSSLYALGFIPQWYSMTTATEYLSEKSGCAITKWQLEGNIKTAYDSDQILYYEYDKHGNLVCTSDFSDRCAVFAVNTGLDDVAENKPIYAQYNKTSRGWAGVYFRTASQIFANMQAYRIGALSFRDYASANAFITDLESLLLPGEVWKYAKASENWLRPKTQYQILESYLKIISTVLMQECNRNGSINKGKVKFSANKAYAAFNTGLLSNKVSDIFIVGEVFPKNWNGSGNFQISNPRILKGARTELKSYGISGKVLETDMVSFFSDLSHIVYDATIPIDIDDIEKLEHCIDDGISRNRFPAYNKEQWIQGFKDDVIDKFKQAIKRAEKIARRNYKYVVPQYRPSPEDNGYSIQFLMPIYFTSNYAKSPDFALVLSRDSDTDGAPFYRMETILELSWAYNNARVLCKPDNTWLKPEEIEETAEDDDI